jgi:alkylated DNA repair protein (DNA oxidative demethylase)
MNGIYGPADDLFGDQPGAQGKIEPLGEGAALLRGFARTESSALMLSLDQVVSRAPFRHMTTRGGHRMSVAMTNAGPVGWVSDEQGYRYSSVDPDMGLPWPEMPASFRLLAASAAAEVGFADFQPDACLINRYEPGARMGLHQDKDESDFRAPIVSVSLGLPAVFLFGGKRRSDRPRRLRLESGDVVVWGGPARLFYHGVAPLAQGTHPLTGHYRINLTFRKAT